MEKVVRPQTGGSCRTCQGTKTVTVIRNKGTPAETRSQVQCPACAGSGTSGLRQK